MFWSVMLLQEIARPCPATLAYQSHLVQVSTTFMPYSNRMFLTTDGHISNVAFYNVRRNTQRKDGTSCTVDIPVYYFGENHTCDVFFC